MVIGHRAVMISYPELSSTEEKIIEIPCGSSGHALHLSFSEACALVGLLNTAIRNELEVYGDKYRAPRVVGGDENAEKKD